VRRRDLVLIVGAAAVGIWLNQISYVYALEYSSASTIALILGATPIFTALIAFAIGLERLHGRFWIAAAVSFAGVALIALGKSGGVSASLKGDALGVATAATWAAYTVAIAPLMQRYSPYRISAVVLVIGWFALAATAAPQLARQDFHLGWEVWALLAFAVLGPLVLTNILWFKAVDRVGPSHATLFANAQPFVAVIFAVLLLGETLSWLQIAGGVAIGVGIWMARRRRVRLVPGGE
jgi:drug/metabolite transporter (DMT)-like permease